MQIFIVRAVPYFLLVLWLALAIAIIRGATIYLQQFQVFASFAVVIATSLFAVNMYAAYEVESSAAKRSWGRVVVAFIFVGAFSAASALTFAASLQQQSVTEGREGASVELASAETLVNAAKDQMDAASLWLTQQRTTLVKLPEVYSSRLADCERRNKGVLTCKQAVERELDKATKAATAEVNTALSEVDRATLAYQAASEKYAALKDKLAKADLSVWVLVQASLPDVLAPLLFSIALFLFRTNPSRIKELENMRLECGGSAVPIQSSCTALLDHALHIESTEGTIKSATETAPLRSKLQILTADLLRGKVALESSGFFSIAKLAKVYNLNPRTVTKVFESLAEEHPDILMYELNSRDSKLWKYKQSNLGKFQLVGADGSLQPHKKFRL